MVKRVKETSNCFYFLMNRQSTSSKPGPTLFPYTTLFRSGAVREGVVLGGSSPGARDSLVDSPYSVIDRKSTRLNASHITRTRMPSSA